MNNEPVARARDLPGIHMDVSLDTRELPTGGSDVGPEHDVGASSPGSWLGLGAHLSDVPSRQRAPVLEPSHVLELRYLGLLLSCGSFVLVWVRRYYQRSPLSPRRAMKTRDLSFASISELELGKVC